MLGVGVHDLEKLPFKSFVHSLIPAGAELRINNLSLLEAEIRPDLIAKSQVRRDLDYEERI